MDKQTEYETLRIGAYIYAFLELGTDNSISNMHLSFYKEKT